MIKSVFIFLLICWSTCMADFYFMLPKTGKTCTGLNEVYKTCGGCEPICNVKFRFCRAVCREGCFCKPGFSTKNGVCIRTDQCDPSRNSYIPDNKAATFQLL